MNKPTRKAIYLYVVVSVSGAAVLALEILGTRILAPFYGVSIFLWSALITVTLAALSTGYFIGGWWADKDARPERLSVMLAAAGTWLFIIPLIKKPILAIIEPLGLRFAVLAAAVVLFYPPLTLLGMISPYAIKIKTANLNEIGRAAGNLYAISTLASVISALVTGFLLIPNFGINRLTLCIGLLLIGTAIVVWIAIKKSKAIAVISVPGLFILAILTRQLFLERTVPAQGLLFLKQSPYGEIRVVEKEKTRYLLIDGGVHTAVNTISGKSSLPYVSVIDLSRKFFEKPGHALLIGLGGGSIVNNFAGEGWKIAAVEIDPVVTAVARNYFGLKHNEGRVYTTDGRKFLIENESRYDIIVMDAFGSSSIPFHLATEESFALVAAHLNPGGIFVINLEADGWHHIIVRSLTQTLFRHFKQVLTLPVEKAPDELGNIVMFASERKLDPGNELQAEFIDAESGLIKNYQQYFAWTNRFIADTSNVPTLTDDLNPIDLWSEEINFVARKDLHRFFQQNFISW